MLCYQSISEKMSNSRAFCDAMTDDKHLLQAYSLLSLTVGACVENVTMPNVSAELTKKPNAPLSVMTAAFVLIL